MTEPAYVPVPPGTGAPHPDTGRWTLIAAARIEDGIALPVFWDPAARVDRDPDS